MCFSNKGLIRPTMFIKTVSKIASTSSVQVKHFAYVRAPNKRRPSIIGVGRGRRIVGGRGSGNLTQFEKRQKQIEIT